MKVIKVPIRDAERVKTFLSQNNIYDHSRVPKRLGKSILFPVMPRIKDFENLIGFSYSRSMLDEVKRERYEDLIDIPNDLKRILPSSYDIIGDIILLELKDELVQYKLVIGEAILKSHSQIRTVLRKSGIHEGEFRTQKYECIAGIDKRIATYKENNVILRLDVEHVYFSPRLSTERKRIYECIKPGETVLVMFSGCGPYPLVISKNTAAKKIVGIEKNSVAHKFAMENVQLNKAKNIELIQGDVREIIQKLEEKFDRIIMPLPKDADTFLDIAFKVSKKGTIIHLYGFEHETEIEKGTEKLHYACSRSNIKYEVLQVIKCGQYSPGKYRICIDFIVR
jgi:tRNA (guanine37-N1)-methyltransferase